MSSLNNGYPSAIAPSPADTRPPGAMDTLASWKTVVLLTLFVILSYVDRSVLSLLVGPLKADLKLTDTELSFLLGLAFALFYGIVSIPAGALVDRFSRRTLLVGAMLLWTLMTACSGLAFSFGWLMVLRTGVGIGEAVLSPCAYSLINESFSSKRRSTAFSIYSLGNACGFGLSLLIVGALLSWLSKAPLGDLPVIGVLRPWQQVLLTLGLIGIPIALLGLAITEPAREPQPAANKDEITFGAAIHHFRSHGNLYWPLYAASLFIGIGLFGLFTWAPAAISRLWMLAPAQVGVTYGSVQVAASIAGLLSCGVLFDSFCGRHKYYLVPRTGAVALLVAAVSIAFAMSAPEMTSMWIGLAIVMFVLPCMPIVSAIVLAESLPKRMMGRFSALTFLVVSAGGTAIGPTLIAYLSDHLFVGPSALARGVAWGSGASFCIAAVLYLIVSIRLQAQPVSTPSP